MQEAVARLDLKRSGFKGGRVNLPQFNGHIKSETIESRRSVHDDKEKKTL